MIVPHSADLDASRLPQAPSLGSVFPPYGHILTFMALATFAFSGPFLHKKIKNYILQAHWSKDKYINVVY